MNGFRLGLRQLRRDWFAGELRVLIVALIIAVAGVTSVNFFTQRIQLALEQQASDLLGADLVYSSSYSIPNERRLEAQGMGLKVSRTVAFQTMALVGNETQLVSLKAVEDHYPLRGKNYISDSLYGQERETATGPQPGFAWVDGRVLTALNLEVGEQLAVGDSLLTIAAIVVREPSQSGGGFFNVAPRLLMHLDDLAATGLVQPASRVRYQLLLAGDNKRVADIYQRWQLDLNPGESLMDVSDSRPEVRTALERGRAFLGLAALVSVLLAGAAVAMAARRFVIRHLDHCAVMRCLGAEQRTIGQIYFSQMLMLGLLASGVGVVIGYFGQWGLVLLLAPLSNIELPAANSWPLLWGMLTGLVTLLGFAIPPILQLKDVPTLRVLRRDAFAFRPNTLLAYGVGLFAFLLLAIIQIGNIKLVLMVLAGLLAVLIVMTLFARLVLAMLKPLQAWVGPAWRFALVNISRRAGHSTVQMVGFGVGLMALLLLAVVRTDLLSEWEERLPADAPNRFLINIQADQLDSLNEFFRDQNMETPQLYPMVRARLTAINGQAVEANQFVTDRAKRLVGREFNLSWAEKMQPDNRLVAGRWWTSDEFDQPWLSLEEGIAKDLGLALGDELSYRAGGLVFTARIKSFRSVEWDSFQANFFVVSTPGLLNNYPVNYISSLYVPNDQHELLNQLVQEFSNITVLDVEAILSQVRSIMDRVSLAVEYVFLFTLLAGLMVMFAAIHTTLDERIHEAAVLRTLGARRSQLLTSIIIEYCGLGLLSGLVASVIAGGVGMVVAKQIFELNYLPGPELWLSGMLLGALGVGVAGTLGTKFVLDQPPLKTLRGG